MPVPVTVEVHWLVCPDCTEVGVQAKVTAVMVAVEEPPPQAVMLKSVAKASRRARRRKLVPQESV